MSGPPSHELRSLRRRDWVSIIFYLQSLCPVVASTPGDLSVYCGCCSPQPSLRRHGLPNGAAGGERGRAGGSGFAGRKLEINYGTE
jgi:hypothetical protein